MRKSYLLVYTDSVGTREEVKSVVDQMSSIITWRYDMPNVFYLISEASAGELAKKFESINGTQGRFIFLEYNDNSQGRLPGKTWHLLNEKYHEEE